MTISGHSLRHRVEQLSQRDRNKLGLLWLSTMNKGKGAVKYSKVCTGPRTGSHVGVTLTDYGKTSECCTDDDGKPTEE